MSHQPSEEEMRAAYEAEIKRLRVEDVLIQTLVSLVNLGGRKAGLAPGTEDERDPEQLRLAIEGSRALLGLVENELGADAASVRDALSQLQMAFAQGAGGAQGNADSPVSGAAPGGGAGSPQGQEPGAATPPPSSGRLWIPGQ